MNDFSFSCTVDNCLVCDTAGGHLGASTTEGTADPSEPLEDLVRRIIVDELGRRSERGSQCPCPHYPQPPVYYPTPPTWPYGYQVWC